MATDKQKNSQQVEVTQRVSKISCSDQQKKTLIGLGLKRNGSSKILENTSSVRGMIEKVKHLLDVRFV